MKFEGPSIDVGSIADGFLVWFNCIREPGTTCAGLLASDTKLPSAIRLWLAACTIGLAINIPAYALHGIKITEAGFFLSSFAALLLVLVAVPACIALALHLYRISSDVSDVFVIYTVVTSAVLPVTTLLSLPMTVDLLSMLKSVKPLDLDAWSIAKELFSRLASARAGEVNPLISAVATPILYVAGLAVMVLFTRFIAQKYEADLFTVMSAVTVGLLFALVPMLAMSLFQVFVMYAFL